MMRKLENRKDLDALGGLYEGRTVDVKLMAPQTAKLVEIMQSFANGTEDGGHIVIGLSEDPNGRIDITTLQPIAYPIQPEGMKSEFGNFDEYRLHLLNMYRSATDAYFEGMVEVHELPIENEAVIVIEVPQSEFRPHSNRHNYRTYMRGDGDTYPMSQGQLEAEITSRQERLAANPRPRIPPFDGEDRIRRILELAENSPIEAVENIRGLIEDELRVAAIRCGHGPREEWFANLNALSRANGISKGSFDRIRRIYEVTPADFRSKKEVLAYWNNAQDALEIITTAREPD